MCLKILILLDVGVSGLSDQKKKTRRDKFIMFFVGVRAGRRLSKYCHENVIYFNSS